MRSHTFVGMSINIQVWFHISRKSNVVCLKKNIAFTSPSFSSFSNYTLGSGGSRKFWWGGILSTKPQKFGCLHPKLRMVFWPKSEIPNDFFAQNQVFSKKKKKKKKKKRSSPKLRVIFRPKSGVLQKKKGLHQNWDWFFGRIRYV